MPQCKAVVVNDTRPERHYGCLAVMNALCVILARADIEPIHFHPVGQPWHGNDEFLRIAATADVIIVNGEGSIHHSNIRAHSLSLIGELCRKTLKIPSILLNATISENNDSIHRMLKSFDLIYCRDEKSREDLASCGIRGAKFAPDLSLFHDFGDYRSNPSRESGLKVGVTDSVFRRFTNDMNKFRDENNFHPNSIKYDPQSTPQYSIYEYARSVADLDLLVTGRYHSVCYAINTRTPFIAIESNTTKISNLLHVVFGNNERVVALGDLPTIDVGKYANWSDHEINSMETFKEIRSKSYPELLSDLRAIAFKNKLD